ncbi:hypothetical protein ON010_g14016 [Phytophthora cinnamomi]|nr:hypothetical protein ON010_g14016 [Phytophthora cinnamomi]
MGLSWPGTCSRSAVTNRSLQWQPDGCWGNRLGAGGFLQSPPEPPTASQDRRKPLRQAAVTANAELALPARACPRGAGYPVLYRIQTPVKRAASLARALALALGPVDAADAVAVEAPPFAAGAGCPFVCSTAPGLRGDLAPGSRTECAGRSRLQAGSSVGRNLPSSTHTAMSTQETSPRSQIRHSRSMDMGVARKIDTSSQMEEVKALIHSAKVFNDDTVTNEVEWFYGPLGIHDFYFVGQSPLVIAHHIQSLIAAKLMSKASNRPMDVKLEQEGENGAFFSVLSNVVGSANEPSRRAARYDAGITETEILERRLEKHYLSGSSGVIGDGVKAGYQYLEKAEATKKRTYRMQCYRSNGARLRGPQRE